MLKIYDVRLNEQKIPRLIATGSFAWEDDLRTAGGITAFAISELKIDKKDEEYVYMIAFDSAMEPKGIFELSHGVCNAAIVGMREVAIRLVLVGATNFVVFHNHPSGNTSPSKNDFRVCTRLQKLGGLLDVPLTDFVIVGNGYFSFLSEDCLSIPEFDENL